MWELDWGPKNWCLWTVVLEKTLESPLDCKEIQPVHSEGDQSWVFFGRNDAETEIPILWPPHAKSWLIGKDSDAEEGLGAGGEGDGRGYDGWMASLTRWTWVWVNSGIWWWTGRPGMLQFMRSQKVMTEWLNWTELISVLHIIKVHCESKATINKSMSCQGYVPEGILSNPTWKHMHFQLSRFIGSFKFFNISWSSYAYRNPGLTELKFLNLLYTRGHDHTS